MMRHRTRCTSHPRRASDQLRGGPDAAGGARRDAAGGREPRATLTIRSRSLLRRRVPRSCQPLEAPDWIWLAECEDEAMTLAKRRLGRRLAGVGIAAASLMLGLETPAFAVSPTITSFSPTSGPAGCVMVISGRDFNNPDVSSVDIGGTPVTSFKIVSATTIWAMVAGTTSGTIHVTNSSGTANSPTDFTITNPGACSPTITTLTPCSGSAGGGGGT